MAGGRRWRLPAQAAGRGVAGAVSIGRLPVCLPFCCQKWQHGHWVRELRMRRSLQEKRPLFMVQPHIVWRSALRWLCAIKPANIIITHGAAAVLLRYREPLHLLRRWCSQFMQWCCEHAQLQPLQHHCATCAETLVLKEQPRVLDKFSATATRCTKQDNR